MRFESEEHKTAFEVSDTLTVRQQLRYKSRWQLSSDELSTYERLWIGLCSLVTEWQSEYVPEATVEMLDKLTDPAAVAAIRWASLELFSWVKDLEDVPKN